MFETMKDAQKLAEQIQAKHPAGALRMAQLLATAGRLCPLMGHSMHEAIAETVEAYCQVNDISVDAVNACVDDIVQAEKTIAELAKLEAETMQPHQGHGIGEDFFKRFQERKG